MKLLIDMNLSPAWVEFFRSRDIEAIHWSQLGNARSPDSEIMDYAVEHAMIVLTNDLDFSAMLAGSASFKPSVIQLRSTDLRPADIGERVVLAIRQVKGELDQGALLTIDMVGARLRILPLPGRH